MSTELGCTQLPHWNLAAPKAKHHNCMFSQRYLPYLQVYVSCYGAREQVAKEGGHHMADKSQLVHPMLPFGITESNTCIMPNFGHTV